MDVKKVLLVLKCYSLGKFVVEAHSPKMVLLTAPAGNDHLGLWIADQIYEGMRALGEEVATSLLTIGEHTMVTIQPPPHVLQEMIQHERRNTVR